MRACCLRTQECREGEAKPGKGEYRADHGAKEPLNEIIFHFKHQGFRIFPQAFDILLRRSPEAFNVLLRGDVCRHGFAS